MTEDKLNSLFDEIRSESAQTSVSEVDQWIDAAVATAATVGLLTTLKLFLIKKPLIMWTTLLTVTGGASLGAVLIFSKPEIKEKPVKKEISYSVPAKERKEEKIEKALEEETPIWDEPINGSNSGKPDLPEDLGALVPLELPNIKRDLRIPAHIKLQTVEAFTKIHVAGALYVELSQGKSCSVQIEPETAKDLVQVEVQNGTLYLKNAPDKKDQREKIVVKVCVENLEELYMSGATSLMSINQLGLDVLTLEADGASNVSLSLKATKLNGDFSGASNVEIAGTCETVNLDVSGASQAKLSGLAMKKVSLDNSGVAQVDLLISEELNIDASGASSTSYEVNSGSATVKIDIETSGSATVVKRK